MRESLGGTQGGIQGVYMTIKRLMLLLSVFAAPSCGDKAITPPAPPQLNLSSPSLEVGPERATIKVSANLSVRWHLDYGETPSYDHRVPAVGEIGPSTEFNETITGLQPARTYYYRVWARLGSDTVRLEDTLQTSSVSIVLSPNSVTAFVGDSPRFTASLSQPLVNADLNWSTTIGSIDSTGLLTNLNAPGTGTITVCLRAYPTVCDSGTITAMFGIDGITATPAIKTLMALDTFRFTVSVTGPNPNHTLIRTATCGTVSENDLFTAPATPGTCTVVWQTADPTKTATAVVTVTPRLSQIAFWRMEDDSTRVRCSGARCEEIFLMYADGSNQRRITTTPWFQDFQPARCGNQKIAFARSLNGGVQTIYLVNRDGSSLQNVTQGQVNAQQPSCSPDGQRIVFSYQDVVASGPFQTGIAVINIDGTGLKRLTSNVCSGACKVDGEPNWSPDGRSIAFDKAGTGDIYQMDTTGGNVTNLTQNQLGNGEPVWSPNGTKIVFVSTRDGRPQIYLMNADGTSQTRVTQNPLNDCDPTWSPDGAKIAFAYNCGDGDIYVINADGTGQTNLTQTPNLPERYPTWLPIP
jgi:hypothetical protein